MQNVVVEKMKVREGTLIKLENISNKDVIKMNKTLKEVAQKAKTWEENMHRLDNVVALSCRNFAEAGITEEMFTDTKVIQLGKIVE